MDDLVRDDNDPGLTSLVVIARFHGIAADASQLRHQAASRAPRFSTTDLLIAAKSLGLKGRLVSVRLDRLGQMPLPAMFLDTQERHFIVVRAQESQILVQEGDTTPPRVVPLQELKERHTGQAILFGSRASLAGELARFDFSWFIPAMVKYRRLLLQVLGTSLLLQLFGLVSPLMFQVVMDKVLTNRAFSTLSVTCTVLLICAVFEAILTGLRNYVFAHTTNRMDVELGARLFRHLLHLPLAYFGSRRVGDTVARVRELENIRNFLTGQALTAALDVFFSVIYLAVMFLYSVPLTLVVIVSLPLYALISGSLNPLFRLRLNAKFARGADSQAFLVESVAAIETVKAQAVEPQFIRRWDQQLAAYVAAGFRVSVLANIGQQLIQLVGKLVTVATLFWGAKLVIESRLTVGQLVAFNMLAQRVASPILRLAQLWQDFQQFGISMQRLGDIINVRTELPSSRQMLPDLQGEIELENVRFRYRADGPLVLTDVNLRISPGEVIGIVGRSGSGKSTLTKLVQRLYVAESGRIRIDGVDLSLTDPAALRRQIGVVLQDNVLFNGTFYDNIALSDPGMPLDKVIHAATLAGAHEFIIDMPTGYNTVVGEHGAGMSGGQRQRIAIARALAGNPRILIFDEATSALDPDTERVIRDQMPTICQGRTVIIISHRISSVRNADRILAMEKGRIVEAGAHRELMGRPGGYYAHLVALQNS
jgi:ATP-binding cassette, subfamily B, bacterial HlyB/CyaB